MFVNPEFSRVFLNASMLDRAKGSGILELVEAVAASVSQLLSVN